MSPVLLASILGSGLLSTASASEVHIEASEDCFVTVAGDVERVKRRKSEKFKVDEGAVPIDVRPTEEGDPTWVGSLQIPKRVAATLACDGRGVQLLRAEAMAAPGAKLANTAMAVGAGASAISDAADATGAAMDDMDAASRGEAVESSRTEITMDVGPNGVSSSTSRTTAGMDGVQHESSQTSIGPDGVSRSTASGRIDGSGVSMEETRRSASIQLPGKGGVVSLTRTDGAAAIPPGTATPSGTPGTDGLVAAEPPEPDLPPPPKDVVFDDIASQALQGVSMEVRDPVATADELKLNIKLTATDDAFLVVERSGIELEKPDSTPFPNDSDKRTLIDPGDSKGTTLVWPGDHRVPELRLHYGGIHRVPVDAPSIDLPDIELAEGEHAVGPAQCEVKKVKRKGGEISAQLKCSTAVKPVVIDTAALSVGGAPNIDRKAGPVLIWPDETTKFDIEVEGADGASLRWGSAVRAVEPELLAFEVAPISASW